MKKSFLFFIGIILIGIILIGIKFYSDFDELGRLFQSEHLLVEPNIKIISHSVSPNQEYKYYKYQFDNGGLGYSRVFWSVIKNNESTKDLKEGLIPDGYKVVGWTENSELILEKWEPYYFIEQNIALKDEMELNEVKIIIKQ